MHNLQHILIIRFSSIGDIVLTTPIARALKKKYPLATIHFLTKKTYAPLLQNSPYISHLHTIEKSISELKDDFKSIRFDAVIDLHKNRLSRKVKGFFNVPAYSYNKRNIDKWILVNLKINRMHNEHIVDRYFQSIAMLGVINDEEGLDYFLTEQDEVNLSSMFSFDYKDYVVVAIGAQHATKQIPTLKLIEIIQQCFNPVVLIGGEEDRSKAQDILSGLVNKKVISTCGELTLSQSAAVIKNSRCILTGDSGMMHVAAALKKKIISVWGSTVPEFGMTPYYGKNSNPNSVIIENKNISCRPCSKLGHSACPKKHFDCMLSINSKEVATYLN
jgi:ADP-heptose:LPS heptosyltransferase